MYFSIHPSLASITYLNFSVTVLHRAQIIPGKILSQQYFVLSFCIWILFTCKRVDLVQSEGVSRPYKHTRPANSRL